MIKLISKIVLYFLFFIFTMLIFLPKENAYFFLEKKLFKYKVILSGEKIDEGIFDFNVNNADIFYNGIKFGKVEKITLDTYIYRNEFEITSLIIADEFKLILPSKINKITVAHNLFDVFSATIKSEGEFGVLFGNINFLDKKITLFLTPSSLMTKKYNNILNEMKLEKGEYKYEYKF